MHGRYGGRQSYNGLRMASLLIVVYTAILAVGTLWGLDGLFVALAVCAAMHGYTFLRADTLALRTMHARPVGEAEQPLMHRIVRELSTDARLPMPRLYVSPTPAPNAFATGRDPRRAALCCTEGLLRILDERELRGVLAHELAHIRNRDILVSSVAAALATVVIFLVDFVWLLPGGGDEDGPGPLGLLFLALLGPLGAMVVQVAVSRSREYRADLTAAQLTGEPLALASALRKLEIGTRLLPLRAAPELVATGHLMIVNPFQAGGGLPRLFSTHPPLADRIARLEALGGVPRHG